MSTVVGYIRSRSGNKRARDSIDHRHAQVYDGTFTRARATSLRQQALAEEEEDVVVSSPKDKKFESLPWDYLRERPSHDFFSTSTTPDSDAPRTPDSAEYEQFFRMTNQSSSSHFSQGHGHRRTRSTPVVPPRSSSASTSAGRKPSTLTKRRGIPVSKSEPSPHSSTFPTINELSDSLSRTGLDKPLPSQPTPARPPPLTRLVQHRPTRSIDIIDHHRKLQAQRGMPLPYSQPHTSQTGSQPGPSPKAEKPTHINMPPRRSLRLPSELHVHTPEYTNALREWFPAMGMASAPKDPTRRNAKYTGLSVITSMDVGVYR